MIPSAAVEDAKISSPGSAPALDRGLDILESLSQAPAGLTLSELSEQLGVPKNSVYRLTQTLLARGYLARHGESLAFRLTRRLLRLAPPHWRGVSLPEVARDAMTELRDVSRETVQLGVLSGLEGIVLDQVEGLESLRIVVDLGLRFPLHNNAPGKLLLAYMSSERQKEVLAQITLTRSTDHTITRRSELRQECERIVANGYSTDAAESDEGIHCVAAPIFDRNGWIAGTLWVSGPAKRLPKSRFRELGVQAIKAGNRITQRIGELT